MAIRSGSVRRLVIAALAGSTAAAMLTIANADQTYVTGVEEKVSPAPPPESPRYMLVDLGTLGGEQSRALAMNDEGTVVGWSDSGPRPFEHARQAFIARLGEPMTLLPSLSWGDTEARDINAFEQVVGAYLRDGELHGIFWNEGVPYDLNDVVYMPRDYDDGPACQAPLRLVIEANAINDLTEIVGCGMFYGDDENVHGIMLVPHQPFNPIEPLFTCMDLGQLPKASECFAFDINACMQAVGVSGDDAFIWGGYIYALDDRDLVSEARAINNWGTVVGWCGDDPLRPMAAKWEGGHRFDLGADPGSVSQANAIADNGYIVGWAGGYSPYFPYNELPRYAMLWEGCVPVFLNAVTAFPYGEPWCLEEATAVDRMGYIAGYGLDPSGFEHAFVLVPWEFIPGSNLR